MLIEPALTKLGAQKYHPGTTVSHAHSDTKLVGVVSGKGGLRLKLLLKVAGAGLSPVAIKLQPCNKGRVPAGLKLLDTMGVALGSFTVWACLVLIQKPSAACMLASTS